MEATKSKPTEKKVRLEIETQKCQTVTKVKDEKEGQDKEEIQGSSRSEVG